MKKFVKYILLSIVCFIPAVADALTCSPKSVKGDGIVNFSHCLVSRCDTYKNGMYYVSTPTYTFPNSGVICNNGNDSPKVVKQVESDCPRVGNACNGGEFKSCTVVIQYDCNRTSSGSSYYTTTTKKKTTTKKTTKKTTTTSATTTTVKIASNTKLNSLTILGNDIQFNPEVYDYTVKIGSDVDSLNVTAVPQDSTSKVQITGNANLVNGSIINVIVTGVDDTISIYKISIEKEIYVKSNNAKLVSLSVSEYNINFNNRINEYVVILDDSVNALTLDYKTEDNKAMVNITGNENLTNGSRVIITVTAEDGTENKYILNVTIKQKSNVLKYIFIIIIILALGAGGYYMYMKFFNNKGGDKYEYE